MKIAAQYSFNNGLGTIENKFPSYLNEIRDVIFSADATICKIKKSEETTMINQLLYSPVELNKQFKKYFEPKGWKSKRVTCDYKNDFYVNGYIPQSMGKRAYRDMDFVKDRVGVEIQFGKYSFMVYNVCAKMTIFSNLEGIEVGVEVVPVKDLADEMSSGVSYFEQFVWDLEARGVSNIDIPVLIIGIAP